LRVAKGGITGSKAKAAAFVAEPQSVQPECQPAAVCLEHRLLRAPESKEVAANVLGAARGEPVRLGGSEEAPRQLECARARVLALDVDSDPHALAKHHRKQAAGVAPVAVPPCWKLQHRPAVGAAVHSEPFRLEAQ